MLPSVALLSKGAFVRLLLVCNGCFYSTPGDSEDISVSADGGYGCSPLLSAVDAGRAKSV